MTEKVRINKVVLSVAQSGKTVVNLYAPGAQYARFPILVLFDLGLLIGIGIDPNSLSDGEPVHCNIWAHYKTGEKLNGHGNPYKNVVSLERIDAPATTTSVDTSAILAELRAIKALLLELATGSPPPAAQGERIRALNHAGSAKDPQATEPEPEPGPELTEREAMMEFHSLVGPAIAEGRLNAMAANDLSQAAGNGGQGWIAALASLKALLAT